MAVFVGAGCRAPPPGPASSPPEGEARVVPGPGQAFLTGTAATLEAEGVLKTPVTAPFTLTASARGLSAGTITNALSGGRRVTIAWDGGQPLALAGPPGGALDLAGPARVIVEAKGARVELDAGGRRLTAGEWRATGPVA
ncbi:MAG: hypothetical protein ACRD0F_06555, partial [Acidimicrobiales bacterium]